MLRSTLLRAPLAFVLVLGLPIAAHSAQGPRPAGGIPVRVDGKVVVPIAAAVYKKNARRWTSMFMVMRFTAGGRLDTRFGYGGRAATRIGKFPVARSVALQPDGKILASGTADNKFALARFTRRGKLDRTFGSGGHVTTPIGSATADDLAQRPDGKIIAAGSACVSEGCSLALARYTRDGSLDESFGSNGIVVMRVGDEETFEAGLGLEPSGEIVVLAHVEHVGGPTSDLLAFTPDGALDSSFGTGGKTETPLAGGGLAIQPDGKIVVAGGTGCGDGISDVFAVARYTANGSIDSGFGTGGVVKTPFFPCGQPADYPYGADANAVAVGQDGSIIAAGGTIPDGISGYRGAFALARYTGDGSLDTSFGDGGTVKTALPFSADEKQDQPTGDEIESIGLRGDGAIVVQGLSNFGPDGEQGAWDLGRYKADGTLDSSFGNHGGLTWLKDTAFCRVPRVVHRRLRAALHLLHAWRCELGHVGHVRSGAARGTVIAQHPAPKSFAVKVRLVVSKGRR